TLSCSGWSVDLQNYAAAVPSNTTYQRWEWNASSTPTSPPPGGHWGTDNNKYDGFDLNTILHQGQGNGSYFYWTSTTTAGKTNHVTVTIDGAVKDDQDFSTTFSDSGTLDDTQSHTLHLVVTAWD